MQLIIGKQNVYTATLAGNVLTISNVTGFDLSENSLLRVVDNTLGKTFGIDATTTFSQSFDANGLPSYSWTFGNPPVGIANTDTLVVYLTVNYENAMYSLVQYQASKV
jgi:hypothetical protein